MRASGEHAEDLCRGRRRYDSLAIDLTSACYSTRERLRTLGAIADEPTYYARVDDRKDRVARCLLGLVTGALPADHRARYAEEFRTELTDHPQRERLLYAVRVVGRSWSLRRNLLGSCRRDVPSR